MCQKIAFCARDRLSCSSLRMDTWIASLQRRCSRTMRHIEFTCPLPSASRFQAAVTTDGKHLVTRARLRADIVGAASDAGGRASAPRLAVSGGVNQLRCWFIDVKA